MATPKDVNTDLSGRETTLYPASLKRSLTSVLAFSLANNTLRLPSIKLGRSPLACNTILYNHQPLGTRGHVPIVGNHHHGDLICTNAIDHVKYLRGGSGIEISRRFVTEQQ